MKLKISVGICLCLFIFIISCEKKSNNTNETKAIDLTKQDHQLKFTKTLWDKITAAYQGQTKFEENKYEFLKGLSIGLVMESTKKGVLKGQATKIQMESFGGTVDFSEILGAEKGPLTLKFETDIGNEKLTGLKVYFHSFAKKRKIKNEIFGSGCDKLLDLTDYFMKTALPRGISLHTGQMRHLSTMVGYLYFILPGRDNLSVSQITFTNKDHPDLFCEGKTI